MGKAIGLPQLVEKSNWRGYAKATEKNIRVSLNQGFSVINFLIEWKDAKQLFTTYLFKEGWAEKVRSYLTKMGKLTPGSYARAIASARLEHEFGTKQFIQDSHTLITILVGWKKYAERIIGEAGIKKTYRNVSLKIPVPEKTQVFSVPIFGMIDSRIRVTTSCPDGIQVNSSLSYSYDVPVMAGVLDRIGQMCDALGINITDSSIAWNAIPFSFVVDWFLNIGEYLHEQRTDWVDIDVTVDDYCRSAKVVTNREVVWLFRSSLSEGSVSVEKTLMIQTDTYFVRERDTPNLDINNVEMPKKGWSRARIQNATALIVQRVPTTNSGHLDAAYANALRRVKLAKKLIENDKRFYEKNFKEFKRILRKTHRKAKRLKALTTYRFNRNVRYWTSPKGVRFVADFWYDSMYGPSWDQGIPIERSDPILYRKYRLAKERHRNSAVRNFNKVAAAFCRVTSRLPRLPI
jgi:hypothetical protein